MLLYRNIHILKTHKKKDYCNNKKIFNNFTMWFRYKFIIKFSCIQGPE